MAIGLSAVYILDSINFILTGQLPASVEQSGHPTSVFFALDLSLLVPAFAVGAIWLWNHKPWGYVLATISMIKGATDTLAFTLVSIWGRIVV